MDPHEELRTTLKAGLTAMSDEEVAQELAQAAAQIEVNAPDDPEGFVAASLWREAAARIKAHAPTEVLPTRWRIRVDVDPAHPLGHFTGLFDGTQAALFQYLLGRLAELGVKVKIEMVAPKAGGKL